jgi:flagellar motor switch/type III secretory pathway protein FliN
MTPPNSIEATAMEVDAVLARLRMTVEDLATLSPDDRLDVEPAAGSQLRVEFAIKGKTIALASVEVVDGRLIATIINNRPGSAGRRIDQWMHRKAKTTD